MQTKKRPYTRRKPEEDEQIAVGENTALKPSLPDWEKRGLDEP